MGHVVNEQRRVLALLHGREPEALHGVATADMGSLPAIDPDADLVAAWTVIGDGLVTAIDDPACHEVTPPPDAALQTRFLCFVGRAPHHAWVRQPG